MNDDLQKYTKEELIDKINTLNKRFGLVWQDKPEEVVKRCQKELPILKEVPSKAIKTKDQTPTNLIIEGDNYHALSVLNYTHRGKIDFIYIDPPYNTGATNWRYNNKYVDTADGFRHSKWLSFMENRLKLTNDLLTDSGVICVTIDDYEAPRLWMLLEKIFGYENHLGTVIIRNNPKGRMTKRKFSLVHEYGIFFGKSYRSTIKKLPVNPSEKTHKYKKDSTGNWYLSVNLRKQGVDSDAYNKKGDLSHRYYPIYFDPNTGVISTTKKLPIKIEPIDTNGTKRIWRRGEDTINKMYQDGDLYAKKTANGWQVYFKFRGGLDGKLAQSIWIEPHFSASDYGTKTLDSILGQREKFQYPKAPEAVKQSILSATNNTKAIILDFFAGSGTTGQAVLELNKNDGGQRQFILCTNNENEIAEEVTYPRIKKVIKGYKDIKGVFREGVGGGVRYLKTDFIDKHPTNTDLTRKRLMKWSADIICVKENAFDLVLDLPGFKVFKSSQVLCAIIFDVATTPEVSRYFNQLKDNIALHIYIFSFNSDTYSSDFSDLKREFKILPVPESILEVYQQIFKDRVGRL